MYQLSAYDLSLINGCFVILGALLGALVSYWLSRCLSAHVAHKKAAAALRLSFSKALSGVRSGKFSSENDIRNYAIQSFDQHSIEMETFRFYVSPKNKNDFDKACKEYQRMVYLRPINHGSNQDPDKFYIEKVENILYFAMPFSCKTKIKRMKS